MKNRGLSPHSDMTGFNCSKVPVILIEMGFLSNPDEDRKLSDANYLARLAGALADGIALTVAVLRFKGKYSCEQPSPISKLN